MIDRRFWLSLLTVDLVLIILSFFVGGYITHLLILLHIYALLATTLNLTVGFTGLLNLGHIALFGVAAYTSTLLTTHGFPYLIALLGAILLTSICSFLLMYATKKLKQDYLALATLGFSYLVYTINLNWIDFTKGARGISGIPRPSLFSFVLQDNTFYLLFTFLVVFLSLFILYKIIHSPFGRLFEALRDDEVSLKVMGKNTTSLKLKSMIISGLFVGLAGSLFAHYIGFIDPFSFALTEIILIFTIVIVGGLASMKGSIVGTIVILLIPEVLRFLPLSSNVLGPLRQIIYALLLIVILLYRPRGIFGRIDLT